MKDKLLKKDDPVRTGMFAVASPLPMIILTSVWCVFIGIGVGIGLLNYDTIPEWLLICCLLPLAVSPALCIGEIVHGCIKIKHKRAWLGILLSVLGLVENFLLIYGMAIGSRF